MPRIKIEVYGGCVTEVTGLPEGWEYEIVDHDHLEEQEATSHKPQATSHKPVRAQGRARPKMIKLQAARTGLTGHLIWDKIGQQKEKYDSIKKSK